MVARHSLRSASIPGLHALLHGRRVRHGTRQATALEDTDLNLSLIESTAVLGRGMELQPVQDRAGMRRGKGLIELPGGVGVEVDLHQVDALGLRVAL